VPLGEILRAHIVSDVTTSVTYYLSELSRMKPGIYLQHNDRPDHEDPEGQHASRMIAIGTMDAGTIKLKKPLWKSTAYITWMIERSGANACTMFVRVMRIMMDHGFARDVRGPAAFAATLED
jgi:hypothetical protein